MPSRVGELRPSQLLWSFGVGSVVDLPNFSVGVLGLDDWDRTRCIPIGEERLLRAVRTRLGPDVQQLLSPPPRPESDGYFDALGEEGRVGVPARTFPQWSRCPICQRLGHLDTRLFEFKPNPFNPDKARYVHSTCDKAKKPPTAVPARFVVACPNGHVDDFPWSFFVHRGPTKCRGQLRFYEVGASLETANLMVQCSECNQPPRSMIDAFGEAGSDSLPRCRGRHPHLRTFEDCDQTLRALLLGASNGWFADTMTVLSVPTRSDRLEQLVEDHWLVLKEAKASEFIGAFRAIGKLSTFGDFSDEEIWDAIVAYRDLAEAEADEDGEIDLKGPEWVVFRDPDPALNSTDFRLAGVDPPAEYRSIVDAVVLAERLREVNALVGFTRIQSPGDVLGHNAAVKRAPLARDGTPKWVPATEVRGEGIFLRFDLDELGRWLDLDPVRERVGVLSTAHTAWRTKRKLEPPQAGFPGLVFVVLHTLSHILMRELALECGYNAASIKERIYASTEAPVDTAGVLLYTAAPDSEGTLGGLVALGQPEELGRLMATGLERASLCASDPLCAEHDPRQDASLHGAACHACLFAPETSCEVGNRYLDRALLVPTYRSADTALFDVDHRG